MLKSYQSVLVPVYRWSFKNFGLGGSLPRFKSLFNVSFLLIIVLTNLMVLLKLMIKSNWITFNPTAFVAITGGAILLMLVNHFIMLNNKLLRSVNMRLAAVSKRNINIFSILLLVNVLFACGLCVIR